MSCDNVAQGPTLLRIFPEARFIHSVRDGRDAASSRVAKGRGVVYPRNAEQGIEWWEGRLRRIDTAADEIPPDRLTVVSLDELVYGDREGTYRHLLDYLDAEDELEMRSYFETKMSAERAHRERWREGLSTDEQSAYVRRYEEALERLERDGVHCAGMLRKAFERTAPGGRGRTPGNRARSQPFDRRVRRRPRERAKHSPGTRRPPRSRGAPASGSGLHPPAPRRTCLPRGAGKGAARCADGRAAARKPFAVRRRADRRPLPLRHGRNAGPDRGAGEPEAVPAQAARGVWGGGAGAGRGRLDEVVPQDRFEAAVDRFSATYLDDPLDSCRGLFDDLLGPLASAEGKRGLVETSARNLHHAPILARLFPDARFVHVVRDGRVAAFRLAETDWGPQDPLAGIDWWAERVRRVDHAVRGEEDGTSYSLGPEQLHVLVLDELLNGDREPPYEALLGFLGVEDETGTRAFLDRWLGPDDPSRRAWENGMSSWKRLRLRLKYERTLGALQREGVHCAPQLIEAYERQ